jgi:hypothetical protein
VFRRRAADPPPADTFIRDAFWIVLGRAPSDDEQIAFRAHHASGGDAGVLVRLLSSPEFHLIFSGLRDDLGTGKDPAAQEAGLRSLGPHERFVTLAYAMLLGRDADPAGLAHYVTTLDAGEARRNVVRVLVTSDEFEARYRPIRVTGRRRLPAARHPAVGAGESRQVGQPGLDPPAEVAAHGAPSQAGHAPEEL